MTQNLTPKSAKDNGKLLYKEMSYKLQGGFYHVYKSLGNGFKESIYHKALTEELEHLGLKIDNQKRIPVYYGEKKVGVYIPDLIVEDTILVELKCKPVLTKNDIQQFWYYLKGSDYKVGYLVNFGQIGKVEIVRRVYDTARELSRSLA